MFAAEKFRHPQPAETAAAERPQKQRLAAGVETHHDERGDAGRAPDMLLPELEEIVALIRGGKAAFERPPKRLGRGHVLENLEARQAAVGNRHDLGAGGPAQRVDVHGARANP